MSTRPYQHVAISDIKRAFARGFKRVLLCMPTGTGKTHTFAEMAAAAVNKGTNTLIVTNRSHLLDQSHEAMQSRDFNAQIIWGKNPFNPNHTLSVAMVETLYNRLLSSEEYRAWIQTISFIIIDECHLCDFDKLFPFFNLKAFVLGVTATPHREKNQKPLKDLYDEMVEPITISQAIAQKFLCEDVPFGLEIDLRKCRKNGKFDDNLVGKEFVKKQVHVGVVKQYRKICDGAKAIAYCASVDSCKALANEFELYGYKTECVFGDTSEADRKRIYAWHESTPNAIMLNVGVLTTGFDSPTTECIILYRATDSLNLFIQMSGRGGRPSAGKTKYIVLDFGGNNGRFGYWSEDRKWQLDAPPKREAGVAPKKECPECHKLLRVAAKECDWCGYEFAPQVLTPKEAELVELKKLGEDLSKMTKPQLYAHFKTQDIKGKARICHLGYLKTMWYLHQIDYCQAVDFTTELCKLSNGKKWVNFDKWLFKNSQFFKNLVKPKKHG